jgi:hypothetical protein
MPRCNNTRLRVRLLRLGSSSHIRSARQHQQHFTFCMEVDVEGRAEQALNPYGSYESEVWVNHVSWKIQVVETGHCVAGNSVINQYRTLSLNLPYFQYVTRDSLHPWTNESVENFNRNLRLTQYRTLSLPMHNNLLLLQAKYNID